MAAMTSTTRRMCAERESAGLGLRAAGAAALFLAACGGGGGGGTDDGAPAASNVGDVLPLESGPRVDLPGRISVFFRVLTNGGKGIADLGEGDFQLFENGNAVSKSESKQRLLSKPQVFRSYSLLLLDRSGSIAQSAQGEQEEIDAAGAYIELVTQSLDSYIALAWFDGETDIRPVLLDDFTPLGFTNDKALLLEAIQNLHDQAPASTSTNLYGAIVSGLATLDGIDADADAQDIAFRSLSIVTFTDGTDQAGTSTLQQALDRVMETDVNGARRYNAFAIGLGSEIDVPKLRLLGPDGSIFASSFDDLVPQFEVVAKEVRDLANSFYFLSYCSPKQNGSGNHVLTVRAAKNGSSAEEDYSFSADYFAGGCGFLDVLDPLPERASYDVRDMIVDEAGRMWVCGGFTVVPAGVESTLFVACFGADGQLDPAFGDGGVLELSDAGFVNSTSLRAHTMVLDEDGSVVVGGIVGGGDLEFGVPRAALWRLTPQGTISDVYVADAPVSPEGDVLNDIDLDSGRGVIAVGRSGLFVSKSIVWRFGAGLQLDRNFGPPNGYVLHQNNPAIPTDREFAVVVLPDDSIVTAGIGYSDVSGVTDLKVSKRRYPGLLDATFHADGIVMGHDVQAVWPGVGADVAVDSAGRIVVGGWLDDLALPDRPALWRFLPDGMPDRDFLSSPFSDFFRTGLATLPRELVDDPDVNFSNTARIRALELHTDDTILATGLRRNAEGHDDLAVWRFDVEGMLEADFNGTGFLVEDGSAGDDSFEGGRVLRIHPDGRIWTAGQAVPADAVGSSAKLALWIDQEFDRVFAPTGAN